MSLMVVTKELLLELARRRDTTRFSFLVALRPLVAPAPVTACPTCPQATKAPFLNDALYRAVLTSAAFNREVSDLADFLQVDQLRIPGVAMLVAGRARPADG
jgi:hypothetical protein